MEYDLHQSGIYKITNTINGKIYIGSTSKSFKHRWARGYNRYLTFSFNKYGKDKFRFDVICYCKPSQCLWIEQFFIDLYQPFVHLNKGYNLCPEAISRKGQSKYSSLSAGQKVRRQSYNASDKGKQTSKSYNQRPEVKERKKQWRNSPEGKLYMKNYKQRNNNLEVAVSYS